MNKKIIKQFEEQFGKEWECSCKTPFGVSSLEIISESANSLLAHYICPNCGKEQMLAASISEDKQNVEEEIVLIAANQLTSDDVLDLHNEIKSMRAPSIRSLWRAAKTKKETAPASDNLTGLKRTSD